MPSTSKPRKQYRRREINRPMTAPAHRRLALEIRLAVETLAAAPSVESYNTVSKMLAALTRAGLKCEALDRANAVMDVVVERYSRVNKVDLKDDEAAALRKAIAAIDGRMATIPVNRIAEAVASVEVFCASVGA
jgi:hypothetical protein